jgi:hypothetical protein
VSWSRSTAAPALADAIRAAVDNAGAPVTVHEKAPQTLNPPCVVVGRETEVLFSTFAFAVDECTFPVGVVGPADGDDTVADLIGLVRQALADDPTLAGTVAAATAEASRNWRNVNVAGVDLLTAEVTLKIVM